MEVDSGQGPARCYICGQDVIDWRQTTTLLCDRHIVTPPDKKCSIIKAFLITNITWHEFARLPSQASLGFNITFPSGYTTHFLSSLTGLGTGATRIADVVLTNSYKVYAGAEKDAITSFLQTGGGLVIGGQAW
jgi:hypothetical protein